MGAAIPSQIVIDKKGSIDKRFHQVSDTSKEGDLFGVQLAQGANGPAVIRDTYRVGKIM